MEETPKGKTQEAKKNKPKFWIWLAVGITAFTIISGLAFAAFYFYQKYKKAAMNSDTAARTEIQDITGAISKFMELPDETPTLATITDQEKLKDYSFFAKAQNGDKVLIFAQSQKAILYRPESRKIIEVVSLISQNGESAPVAGEPAVQPVEENQPSPAPEENAENKTEEKIKVAVYNGTDIKGLAGNLADKISALENMEIMETTNAQGTYNKTLVINLSGAGDEVVNKIAEAVGGEKGELPAGETKPDADILIIGGKQ